MNIQVAFEYRNSETGRKYTSGCGSLKTTPAQRDLVPVVNGVNQMHPVAYYPKPRSKKWLTYITNDEVKELQACKEVLKISDDDTVKNQQKEIIKQINQRLKTYKKQISDEVAASKFVRFYVGAESNLWEENRYYNTIEEFVEEIEKRTWVSRRLDYDTLMMETDTGYVIAWCYLMDVLVPVERYTFVKNLELPDKEKILDNLHKEILEVLTSQFPSELLEYCKKKVKK